MDDNHDVADSTALLLQTVGFETLACYDGHSALREARNFRPGICFLDLNMPGMAGDELAGHLRTWAGEQTLVLVALTAMSGEEHRIRIVSAGFDLHLIKPVDPLKLVQVVDTLFRARNKTNIE